MKAVFLDWMLAGNSTLALSVIPCADSMRVVATVANAELRAMSHISSASTSSSSWQISFAAGPYGYDFKFQAVQVLFSWHLRGYSSSCSSAGMGTTEVSSDTWDTTAGRLKSKQHRPLTGDNLSDAWAYMHLYPQNICWGPRTLLNSGSWSVS